MERASLACSGQPGLLPPSPSLPSIPTCCCSSSACLHPTAPPPRHPTAPTAALNPATAVNATSRHVDVKNQAAEEVLRQAVYLRSSLGRKASLQARPRGPCWWGWGWDAMRCDGLLRAVLWAARPCTACALGWLLALPSESVCTAAASALFQILPWSRPCPPPPAPAGEAPDAVAQSQHPGAMDARGAGCAQSTSECMTANI